MFQLLHPISLIALAGISIPILLHLWNVRKGKVLKVGSILLLQDTATRQARSFRFTDILLLILRCLLIIVLSMQLAKPIWKTELSPKDQKGWLLVEKESLRTAYRNYHSTIDSLLNAGYQLHYFHKGFYHTTLADTLTDLRDTLHHDQPAYWSLLKQLNEEVPATLPVFLITNNSLNRFAGTRPDVSLNLKWLTYQEHDSVGNLLVNAVRANRDSLLVATLMRSADGNAVHTQTISINGNKEYTVNVDKDKLIVQSHNKTIVIDTGILRVAIYTDNYLTDARYLEAALDAIRQTTGMALEVSAADAPDHISSDTDCLFWLSQKDLPKDLPSQVFRYQQGRPQEINSWLADPSFTSIGEEPVAISKIVTDSNRGRSFVKPVWQDAYGHVLLGKIFPETNSRRSVYQLSPFNPDQLWSETFPERIYHLLMDNTTTGSPDLRSIDPPQIQPVQVRNHQLFAKEKFVETTDLENFFWLLAFLIFCCERAISLTRKPVSNA